MKLLSSQLQFLALAIMIMTASAAMAQGGYVAPMSLDEAINNPSIRDNKVRSSVSNYQMKQAKILLEDRNLIVETMRNKEVIVISIPADLLFEPNETELSDDASDVLERFRGFLRTPDFYRMALAMYHDDSCSNSFSKSVSLSDRESSLIPQQLFCSYSQELNNKPIYLNKYNRIAAAFLHKKCMGYSFS